jgi:hypothetical protein
VTTEKREEQVLVGCENQNTRILLVGGSNGKQPEVLQIVKPRVAVWRASPLLDVPLDNHSVPHKSTHKVLCCILVTTPPAAWVSYTHITAMLFAMGRNEVLTGAMTPRDLQTTRCTSSLVWNVQSRQICRDSSFAVAWGWREEAGTRGWILTGRGFFGGCWWNCSKIRTRW